MQVAACKVFWLASVGVGGDHIPFHRVFVHFGKVQRIFAACVAQRPINILQVQKCAAMQHIARAHVLLAHRVFLVKGIVAPVLAAQVGRQVRTACRDADTVVKLHPVFHAPVKYACRINAAQPAAHINNTDLCHRHFHLSCNKLYTLRHGKTPYNPAAMPEFCPFYPCRAHFTKL